MADATTVDELMHTIAQEYDSLSRQLKVIAKYVEQNRVSLMLKRINDIAVECDVQASAIVRFAKRFGLSGFSSFSELQEVFREAYTSKLGAVPNYKQRIRKMIGSRDGKQSPGAMAREFFEANRMGLAELSASLDDAQFAQAVKLLYKADSIHVAGVRRAFAAASYFSYTLQHSNKPVYLISGLGGGYRQQMRSVRPNDVQARTGPGRVQAGRR